MSVDRVQCSMAGTNELSAHARASLTSAHALATDPARTL